MNVTCKVVRDKILMPGEFVEYDTKMFCIYYVVASLSDLCCRLSLVCGLSVFTVIYLSWVEFGRDNAALFIVFILLVRIFLIMEQNISYQGLPDDLLCHSVVLKKCFHTGSAVLSESLKITH